MKYLMGAVFVLYMAIATVPLVSCISIAIATDEADASAEAPDTNADVTIGVDAEEENDANIK